MYTPRAMRTESMKESMKEMEMDDLILSKLAWAFGTVVVYGLLRWRLMVATHEFRVRTGAEAYAFGQQADPKQPEGRVLVFWAERAYRPTTPWLLVFSLLVAILRPNSGRRSSTNNAEAASATQALNVRLFWALISTSPLACILALLVLTAALLWRSYVEALRDGITTAIVRVKSAPRAAPA